MRNLEILHTVVDWDLFKIALDEVYRTAIRLRYMIALHRLDTVYDFYQDGVRDSALCFELMDIGIPIPYEFMTVEKREVNV